jgi:ATP-binding cassette, subfamily C (CFTR/MRP), member 1
MEATQKRVNLTTELFGSIKAVKMLGFSKILSRVVQAMRVAELDLSKGYRKLSVTNTCLSKSSDYLVTQKCLIISGADFIANLPNIIIPVITFAAFALSQNSLNVAQAFSSLSILSLITSPIANMIYAIPQLFSSQGCFQRIQEYLQKEPRHDLRQVITPSDRIQGDKYHRVSCTSGNLLELESLSNPARELDVGSRVDKQILSIRDGSFGWHENCQTTIQGVNLHLPGLSLTMVVGPVGCGKSTFLKGLLGETFTSKGSVQLSTREFAFCDQIPWIRNGTIRENIIGHMEFDEAWYNSVIFACALDTDFQQLPNGDSTTVGSKGMKLSGGQRQRVVIHPCSAGENQLTRVQSMARASYARKKLAIFDDVLSGLDALTEEKVYTRLLSRNGLLRTSGTAIILATHSGQYTMARAL